MHFHFNCAFVYKSATTVHHLKTASVGFYSYSECFMANIVFKAVFLRKSDWRRKSGYY